MLGQSERYDFEEFQAWLLSIFKVVYVGPELPHCRLAVVMLLPLLCIFVMSEAPRDLGGAPSLFTFPKQA